MLALLLLPAAVTSAQSRGKTPPGYSEAVSQALTELEAGNFPEALEEFRRAHAIFPNARTLRGLGMVEFELRHYAESARLLKEALQSQVRPLDARLRSETETLLARSSRYLGEVSFTVSPEFATLAVDGATVDLTHPSVTLEVGEHVVEARAPEHTSQRRTITVKGGEHEELRFMLERPSAMTASAAMAPQSEPASHVASDTDGRTWMRWTGGIALGVGVAAQITGWAWFGHRTAQGEDLRRELAGSDQQQKWRDSRAPMLGFAVAGSVLSSLGVAFLATAAKPQPLPWWLASTVGAAGLGLAAWGAVDLARGASCDLADARACVSDEERQDRGALLLATAAPLLMLPLGKLIRTRSEKRTVRLSLGLHAAQLSATW